jgi:hypothetical protein
MKNQFLTVAWEFRQAGTERWLPDSVTTEVWKKIQHNGYEGEGIAGARFSQQYAGIVSISKWVA